MVVKSAASLKPEIRLADAVSQFEASLSSDEKAVFRSQRAQALHSPPDTNAVMCFTAQLDHQRSGYAGRCLGPRFTSFLQGVQQFAALGDVIIGGSQNIIACGVWSLVRMSILVSILNATTVRIPSELCKAVKKSYMWEISKRMIAWLTEMLSRHWSTSRRILRSSLSFSWKSVARSHVTNEWHYSMLTRMI
jgi:hypothetical protein